MNSTKVQVFQAPGQQHPQTRSLRTPSEELSIYKHGPSQQSSKNKEHLGNIFQNNAIDIIEIEDEEDAIDSFPAPTAKSKKQTKGKTLGQVKYQQVMERFCRASSSNPGQTINMNESSSKINTKKQMFNNLDQNKRFHSALNANSVNFSGGNTSLPRNNQINSLNPNLNHSNTSNGNTLNGNKIRSENTENQISKKQSFTPRSNFQIELDSLNSEITEFNESSQSNEIIPKPDNSHSHLNLSESSRLSLKNQSLSNSRLSSKGRRKDHNNSINSLSKTSKVLQSSSCSKKSTNTSQIKSHDEEKKRCEMNLKMVHDKMIEFSRKKRKARTMNWQKVEKPQRLAKVQEKVTLLNQAQDVQQNAMKALEEANSKATIVREDYNACLEKLRLTKEKYENSSLPLSSRMGDMQKQREKLQNDLKLKREKLKIEGEKRIQIEKDQMKLVESKENTTTRVRVLQDRKANIQEIVEVSQEQTAATKLRCQLIDGRLLKVRSDNKSERLRTCWLKKEINLRKKGIFSVRVMKEGESNVVDGSVFNNSDFESRVSELIGEDNSNDFLQLMSELDQYTPNQGYIFMQDGIKNSLVNTINNEIAPKHEESYSKTIFSLMRSFLILNTKINQAVSAKIVSYSKEGSEIKQKNLTGNHAAALATMIDYFKENTLQEFLGQGGFLTILMEVVNQQFSLGQHYQLAFVLIDSYSAESSQLELLGEIINQVKVDSTDSTENNNNQTKQDAVSTSNNLNTNGNSEQPSIATAKQNVPSNTNGAMKQKQQPQQTVKDQVGLKSSKDQLKRASSSTDNINFPKPLAKVQPDIAAAKTTSVLSTTVQKQLPEGGQEIINPPNKSFLHFISEFLKKANRLFLFKFDNN